MNHMRQKNPLFIELILTSAMVLAVVLAVATGLKGQSAPQAGVLRVAAPSLEQIQSGLSPFGPGFEYELLKTFCSRSGMRLEMKGTKTWKEAWNLLRSGRADLVLGAGVRAPRGLASRIFSGPKYGESSPVMVRSAKRHGLNRAVEAAEPVLMTANPELENVLERGRGAGSGLTASMSRNLDVTPVLSALDSNQARFAVLDGDRYRLWQPFFGNVRPETSLPGTMSHRWHWRKDSPAAPALHAFWRDLKEDGSILGDLRERYFGFLPEKTDYFEIWHLARTVREKMPRYRDAILEAARENGLDPLLLTAVIYQESRFDPHARSRTGVRGLMQITTATASDLGVNRNDPIQSIQGGARYLRQLFDRLDGRGLPDWERWFMALAAYNQGPGHLDDAMALSRRLGGSGETWRELKLAYPKLAWERWYKNARYGYARGFEAVDYVDRIRYYYYVLHGFVVLSRPEAEHLATLVFPVPGLRT